MRRTEGRHTAVGRSKAHHGPLCSRRGHLHSSSTEIFTSEHMVRKLPSYTSSVHLNHHKGRLPLPSEPLSSIRLCTSSNLTPRLSHPQCSKSSHHILWNSVCHPQPHFCTHSLYALIVNEIWLLPRIWFLCCLQNMIAVSLPICVSQGLLVLLRILLLPDSMVTILIVFTPML